MKILFREQQFRKHNRVGNVSVKGVFLGLGIDFLAVMSKLYELPCLWFSEGLRVEVDFKSEKLTLNMPGGQIEGSDSVTQEIPLSDLVLLSAVEVRQKYIVPFAANAAEFNFGMPKTAKAIREMWQRSLISELAVEEGHPVLDDEIENLLFREEWEISTSYN